jgi:hypothetical protein
MISTLDTAHYNGIGGHDDPAQAEIEDLLGRYQTLGIALNEVNRSLGLLDVVPEVFVAPVVEKFRFIHGLVRASANRQPLAAEPTAAAG